MNFLIWNEYNDDWITNSCKKKQTKQTEIQADLWTRCSRFCIFAGGNWKKKMMVWGGSRWTTRWFSCSSPDFFERLFNSNTSQERGGEGVETGTNTTTEKIKIKQKKKFLLTFGSLCKSMIIWWSRANFKRERKPIHYLGIVIAQYVKCLVLRCFGFETFFGADKSPGFRAKLQSTGHAYEIQIFKKKEKKTKIGIVALSLLLLLLLFESCFHLRKFLFSRKRSA